MPPEVARPLSSQNWGLFLNRNRAWICYQPLRAASMIPSIFLASGLMQYESITNQTNQIKLNHWIKSVGS